VLGVGCWVLGVGCWVLGFGFEVLGVEYWDFRAIIKLEAPAELPFAE
jgi:hypothetical protein